jgi:hypothetical protein
MITHFDIDTIFEHLVTACAKFGQKLVPARVVSTFLLDILQITVSSVFY